MARGAGRSSLFLALSCVGFISSPALAADDVVQSDARDQDEIIVTGEGLRNELESPRAMRIESDISKAPFRSPEVPA